MAKKKTSENATSAIAKAKLPFERRSASPTVAPSYPYFFLINKMTEPHFREDKPFDAIVSNPPCSVKWVGSDDPILIKAGAGQSQ